MEPYSTNIIIYAASEGEVAAFQKEFYDFVNEKRSQGIAVSARKLMQALKMFRDNKYVNNYLKM